MTPDELLEQAAGAKLSNFLPLIEAELDKVDAKIEADVYRKLDKGELNPVDAVAAWMSKQANQRLRKHLQTRVQVGMAALSTLHGGRHGT